MDWVDPKVANNSSIIAAKNRQEGTGDGVFWGLCNPYYKSKVRNCLKCRRQFKSNVERVCATCARTNARSRN